MNPPTEPKTPKQRQQQKQKQKQKIPIKEKDEGLLTYTSRLIEALATKPATTAGFSPWGMHSESV
jgi:hypothetical protein